MSTKSSAKIKEYKVLEAFVQCNFLDGYSYIDKAGEIVNLYVRENKEIPNFQMGLKGLVMQDVSKTIAELKVSSNHIWIHFIEPKNLGDIASDATELLNKILKILKPTMYKRIGWRTYFAYEGIKESNPIDKLELSEGLKSYELQNIVLAKKFKDVNARLEISPLTSTIDHAKKALLFDIDLSLEISTVVPKESLEKLRDTFKSDELLDSLEELRQDG